MKARSIAIPATPGRSMRLICLGLLAIANMKARSIAIPATPGRSLRHICLGLLAFGMNFDHVVAQQGDKPRTVRLAYYNVENLFDTLDNPAINDNEFLPGATRNWNSYKYNGKLRNLAKVILNLSEDFQPPALIGLSEVENVAVLEDLVQLDALKHLNYSIIHRDSRDMRGIDVALLYRPEVFTPVKVRFIRVSEKETDGYETREILYVAGMFGRDTLDVFVNHWPSRWGGVGQSEPRRMAAAGRLRVAVDSLRHVRPRAAICIMGDFNDDPEDRSLAEVLGASPPGSGSSLINLTAVLKRNDPMGTLKYRLRWNWFDQFIVSASLMDSSCAIQTTPEHAGIFKPDWLLEPETNNSGMKPFRTYRGMKYAGGFSDHLPVYLDLILGRP